MKQELMMEVVNKYGLKATIHDAITFMFENGLIHPKGVRDWQIANKFIQMSKQNPDRPKRDIMEDISVMDELGKPSTSTVRDAIQLFCKQ
jgi:hypothetical protein